jgi:hypothetical protein
MAIRRVKRVTSRQLGRGHDRRIPKLESGLALGLHRRAHNPTVNGDDVTAVEQLARESMATHR